MEETIKALKEQLDRIESKQNGEYSRMDKEIKDHSKADEDKFKKQEENHLALNKKLNFIASKLKEPTEEEKIQIERVFNEKIEKAMINAIKGASKWSYATLLIVAGVVGALFIIFGGLKAFLGLIGFTRN